MSLAMRREKRDDQGDNPGSISTKDLIMPVNTLQDVETALYSYQIASADLKYIEINTRQVVLRADPERGLVVRGEVPECGPLCHATLSEIFLEHAMSCKGCDESAVMLESVLQFAERLGVRLARVFLEIHDGETPRLVVPRIFRCVVASMGVPYESQEAEDRIAYRFQESPLDITGGKAGLHLWVSTAFQGFIAFFNNLLETTGGGWRQVAPRLVDSDHSLMEIRLERVP